MTDPNGDRIEIRGIRALGRHGVLPAEKREEQPFVVDVEVEADLSWAGASDDLADTVSYAEVAADVVAILQGPSVDLVEHLAERIAGACLAREPVEAVSVTVHKPQAPVGVAFGDVAVRVRRVRRRRAVVALGANVGDAATTLSRAVCDVAALPGVRLRSVSGLLDTDPVGGPDQPGYLNAVLLADTARTGRSLLRDLHGIEADHARVRDVRWGPRTLDLDLIQLGDPSAGTDVVVDDRRLTLPHPRAHERAFVLGPWARLDPAAALRVQGRAVPVTELLARLSAADRAGVRPGPPWQKAW